MQHTSTSLFKVTLKLAIVFLLACCSTLSGGAPSAHAASSILYVKPTAVGSKNCTSWANACTLQSASGTAASGDQIWVAKGTYTPGTASSARSVTFQIVNGVSVYGGFVGTETALNQRSDWTVNQVILSGDLKGDDSGFTHNGENCYHVVTGHNNATLDSVYIIAGNANGSALNGRGGGHAQLQYQPDRLQCLFCWQCRHQWWRHEQLFQFDTHPDPPRFHQQ
jgi:hypothetical protein